MSHFSVLVVTKDKPTQEILEELLLPFEEVFDKDSKYVVEIDHTNNLQEEYHSQKIKYKNVNINENIVKEYKNIPEEDKNEEDFCSNVMSFEDFVNYFYGYTKKDDKFVTYENPNAKWDWYVVGGRWKDFFVGKDGRNYNFLQKKDIDFDTLFKEANEKANELWNKYYNVVGDKKLKSWNDCLNEIKESNIDYKREDILNLYQSQPNFDLVDKLSSEIKTFNCPIDFFKGGNKEEFFNKMNFSAIGTYATIHEGKWYEKGRMGWFGMSFDENYNWESDYLAFIENLDENDWFTIVDCHI